MPRRTPRRSSRDRTAKRRCRDRQPCVHASVGLASERRHRGFASSFVASGISGDGTGDPTDRRHEPHTEDNRRLAVLLVRQMANFLLSRRLAPLAANAANRGESVAPKCPDIKHRWTSRWPLPRGWPQTAAHLCKRLRLTLGKRLRHKTEQPPSCEPDRRPNRAPRTGNRCSPLAADPDIGSVEACLDVAAI